MRKILQIDSKQKKKEKEKEKKKKKTFVNHPQRVEPTNTVSSHQSTTLIIIIIRRTRHNTVSNPSLQRLLSSPSKLTKQHTKDDLRGHDFLFSLEVDGDTEVSVLDFDHLERNPLHLVLDLGEGEG